MTTTLKFQDPPPSYSGDNQTGWKAIAAELRANPGKWALLEESVTTKRAKAIRTAMRYHNCQVTTRGGEGDNVAVYVRFADDHDA